MMPTNKMILENLEEMLGAYIEGNLSEKEEAAIDGILSENSSLNDVFIETCQDIMSTGNSEGFSDSLDNDSEIVPYDELDIDKLLLEHSSIGNGDEYSFSIEDGVFDGSVDGGIAATISSNHIDNPLQIGEIPDGTFSPNVKQGFSDTCAVMSQKLILDAYGIHYTEEELREQAKELGLYREGYGTSLNDMGKLLIHNNCPCTNYIGGNIADLVKAFSEGKMVMMAVDSGELWRKGFLGRLWEKLEDKIPFIGGPDHALLVTGIDASDPENIMVIVTDPGRGDLNIPYPMEQFIDAAKDSHFFMTITDYPKPHVFDAFDNPQMQHLPKIGELNYHSFIDKFGQYFSLANSLGVSMPENVVEDLFSMVSGEDESIDLNEDISTGVFETDESELSSEGKQVVIEGLSFDEHPEQSEDNCDDEQGNEEGEDDSSDNEDISQELDSETETEEDNNENEDVDYEDDDSEE